MLRPQDIVIIGKILAKGDQVWAQGHIASELGMSPSEVNGGIKRAQKSGLMRKEGRKYKLVKPAIEEFLVHGLRYVFPAERGEPTRGLPTAYAAAPLNSKIALGDDLPPVWPDPNGKQHGYGLKPLYHTVPAAARNDLKLYQFLAVVDALRDSRSRDRIVARQALEDILRGS